ncbi:histone-lysine N-methyltransferase SUVR2 [Dorcoceras hygrometricum]|uniref:Histone-lysine N-methyltransferase SUVR2 n=1 Tax=Dorcoceras hygrometricum TaxID=472368 RepID=A0A2Z7DDU1_9LAMI|nr:histone-lysine N-methyltransferase SUVR2 [Dorcoceras hygrometricum]
MSDETKKKVAAAFDAMKNLGISIDKVKPVLKNMLKLYDKNWELIEAENYRALADAIFESEEAEAAEHSKKNMNEKENYMEEDATDEPERPLKRLRLRYQEGQTSSINNPSAPETPLIIPKEEPDVLPENQPLNQNASQNMVEASQPTAGNTIGKSQTGMLQSLGENKGKQPASSSMAHERGDPCLPSDSHGHCVNTPLTFESISPSHSMQLLDKGKGSLFPIPKKGSVSDNSMAVMHLKGPDIDSDTFQSLKRKNIEKYALITYHRSESDSGNGTFPSDERASNGNHAMISDVGSSNLEIASSPCGEVKLLLNCDLALRKPDFHMPGPEAVLKSVEDNFLRSYKAVDPQFSMRNLMQEMCKCVMRLGTESTNESPEATGVTLASNLLKNSSGMADSHFDAEIILPKMLLPPPSYDGFHKGLQPEEMGNGEDHVTNGKLQDNDIEGDSSLMVGKECLLTSERIMSLHDAVDISKGQEKVAITLVNEFNIELAPSFCYITQNVIFQNANVKFALARIGENKCCSTCFGDCLSISTPCACGIETGGAFVYTLNGLVKDDFLEECISLTRDPKKHRQFFCKLCPLQKIKDQDVIEPCKGHLMRKFIKECWWKCGCNKQCGNRVVQRGISYHIQVFMTAEGKGWGLRTLEDIPKGAFVCEYVGEVLTSSEFFDRVSLSPQELKYSYPVLLDADWGSKGVVKDDEALYLDATGYGNVARFINHRCYDSNLVAVPVEMETPEHHYYHLALFTTRNVKAMEELTWGFVALACFLDWLLCCSSHFCFLPPAIMSILNLSHSLACAVDLIIFEVRISSHLSTESACTPAATECENLRRAPLCVVLFSVFLFCILHNTLSAIPPLVAHLLFRLLACEHCSEKTTQQIDLNTEK